MSPTNRVGAGRRDWIGLAVLALPCLLYSMDLTVLDLALPRLSAALSPSSAELLWIVDIYGFLVAASLVTMGNLGDRIGRRRLLLIGASAFGLTSILAAFATSPAQLILARAVLGVAGATLAPSTLSLIRNMFSDARQRTVAISIWTTSFSVGATLGPLLGGLMLQHFWWGSVFLLAVPVMLLLLVLGPWLLPEYRDPGAGRLDPWSALLSLATVLSAIYGMKLWAQDGPGWTPALCVVSGLGVGVAFVRRQRRLSDPRIDFSLFRRLAFSVSLATFTLTTAIVFGSYVFIAQYLQLVLGLSPMQAGLWTLPGSAGVIVGSLLAPAIVRRARPAWVIGGGLTLASAGFAVLTQVDTLGLRGIIAGTVLTYLGLGPVFTLGTELVVGAAPAARAGAAAAISETSSEFGGALGIAVLGSIGTTIYRSGMASTVLSGVPAEVRLAARDTLGGAAAAAKGLSPELGAQLLDSARSAFADAMQCTVAICAVLAALTAVVAMVVLRRVRIGDPAPQPAEPPPCLALASNSVTAKLAPAAE